MKEELASTLRSISSRMIEIALEVEKGFSTPRTREMTAMTLKMDSTTLANIAADVANLPIRAGWGEMQTTEEE